MRIDLVRALRVSASALVLVLPLIAGSIWIYAASAGAFRFQHDVRLAQGARAALIRSFLATESDVRGYAATNDPYFLHRYETRVRSRAALARSLEADMRALKIPQSGNAAAEEENDYRRWSASVATPLIRRMSPGTMHLLRDVDPSYSALMLAGDKHLAMLLNDAEATSELRRQNLLRRILIASIVLVASAAAVLITLLLRQSNAERARLRAAMLYDEERRVSRVLQSAFAPVLPALRHASLHALYVPAVEERQIGGDWYEAVELRDGRILLIIGDVAGHGLGAAVGMNRARQAILSAAVSNAEPAHILRAANDALTAQAIGMVTAACCIVDPQNEQLVYGSAGHPAPIIVSPAHRARALESGGPPLGVVAAFAWESARYSFERGSAVILYTDGLIEEGRDVIASTAALLNAAARIHLYGDPATALFDALVPARRPRDDVAVVCLTTS